MLKKKVLIGRKNVRDTDFYTFLNDEYENEVWTRGFRCDITRRRESVVRRLFWFQFFDYRAYHVKRFLGKFVGLMDAFRTEQYQRNVPRLHLVEFCEHVFWS